MRLPTQDDERRDEAAEYLIDQVRDLLTDVMQERGVSRAELARRLGVRSPIISNRLVEDAANPKGNMTLRTLADMADALGYEVEVAFIRHGTPRGPDE